MHATLLNPERTDGHHAVGYTGIGYQGGRWDHGGFRYNRAVNNISQTRITNVYTTVVNNVTVNRISYNGGPRGIALRPSRQEQEAIQLPHSAMTQQQVQHLQAARVNPILRASFNHGQPEHMPPQQVLTHVQQAALYAPRRAPQELPPQVREQRQSYAPAMAQHQQHQQHEQQAPREHQPPYERHEHQQHEAQQQHPQHERQAER